jgi:hypothetical protein
MDDALKACGGRGFRMALDDEAHQLLVKIVRDAAPERVDIDVAGAHDRRGVPVVEERQQKMLKCRVLMIALVGIFERTMQGRF